MDENFGVATEELEFSPKDDGLPSAAISTSDNDVSVELGELISPTHSRASTQSPESVTLDVSKTLGVEQNIVLPTLQGEQKEVEEDEAPGYIARGVANRRKHATGSGRNFCQRTGKENNNNMVSDTRVGPEGGKQRSTSSRLGLHPCSQGHGVEGNDIFRPLKNRSRLGDVLDKF